MQARDTAAGPTPPFGQVVRVAVASRGPIRLPEARLAEDAYCAATSRVLDHARCNADVSNTPVHANHLAEGGGPSSARVSEDVSDDDVGVHYEHSLHGYKHDASDR